MASDSQAKRDGDATTKANGDVQQEKEASAPSGQSKLSKILKKTGLEFPIPLLMVKAAIAPTVAIAFYQSSAVSKEYGNQGYLVAIASVLGFSVLPRAKFIQSMLLNLLSACIATAVVLLSLWSAVQARKHTTPKGHPLGGYNSSASAVCAIWLVFQVFLINALRSKLPQLQFPVILYAIFCNISLVYGVQFPTMSAAIAFAKTLLKGFLTGFALATATHFLILPVNARMPVFGELTAMLTAMRGVLKAHSSFMQSYGGEDLLPSRVPSSEESDEEHSKFRKQHINGNPIAAKESALKAATSGLVALVGKLQADVPFAKREIAFGKLNSQDISEIVRRARNIVLPLLGLGSLIDIAHNVSRMNQWDKLFADDKSAWDALSDEEKKDSEHALEEWQTILRTMHEPFGQIATAVDEALEHVLLVLELKKRPKTSKKNKRGVSQSDVESHKDTTAPGETDFAARFEQNIQKFYDSRALTLHAWCERRGVQLPPNSFDPGEKEPWSDITSKYDRRHRGQLYVILYNEYLLYAAAKAVLELVRWSDTKVTDGTMSKSRFIFPGIKRLRKWAHQTCTQPESADPQNQIMSGSLETPIEISLGDAFTKHDPEHLPPANTFERGTDWLRLIPRIFRSEHSAHGLRAAAATMSIGIIAFLHDTQTFFIANRLVWAMIMVAFSMQRTSGQALFQFGMRLAGTFLAMVASYIVWYIVDGHRAGVIVFLFVWLLLAFYILFTHPRYAIVGVLAAITTILIIGYELQVQQIGKKLSESNGQPAYPTYTLAPYRLATVAAGLFVAYVWTIFPYPVTEHSELRRDVSGAMHLLATYYSVVHETILSRTYNTAGSPTDKRSPGRTLERARHKVFSRTQLLLTQMRDTSSYTPWQLNLGGRFPRESYDAIADHLMRIMRCTALMGYASTSFATTHTDPSTSRWLTDFQALVSRMDPTSHAITNRLSLLSNCLSNGHALPPYMPPFEPFHLAKRITDMDRDVMSVRHLAEPGYAAFAVMSIASRQLVDELNGLTAVVRGLVGEMDFSWKMVQQHVRA